MQVTKCEQTKKKSERGQLGGKVERTVEVEDLEADMQEQMNETFSAAEVLNEQQNSTFEQDNFFSLRTRNSKKKLHPLSNTSDQSQNRTFMAQSVPGQPNFFSLRTEETAACTARGQTRDCSIDEGEKLDSMNQESFH